VPGSGPEARVPRRGQHRRAASARNPAEANVFRIQISGQVVGSGRRAGKADRAGSARAASVLVAVVASVLVAVVASVPVVASGRRADAADQVDAGGRRLAASHR